MNSTAACPSFVEFPANVSSSYCVLPSCINNTAVMSVCCGNSNIVPYYYDSGFSYGSKNETSGNASWCHVANGSISSWGDCVSDNGGRLGMCSFENAKKNGAAAMSFGRGFEGIIGVLGLVVLLQNLL